MNESQGEVRGPGASSEVWERLRKQLGGMWYWGAAMRLASRDLSWVPQKLPGRTIEARVGENLGAGKPGPFQECIFACWFQNNKVIPRKSNVFLRRSTRYFLYTGASCTPTGRKIRDVKFPQILRLKVREGKLVPGHTAGYGPQPDLLASRVILISWQHTALWFGATVGGEKKSLETECFLKYHLQFIALRISHW